MGCMAYPILGWDARIPSWDVMYGMSHPGMGCKNPILGWDVWNIPSWDGMQESHPGMGCMGCPILGWDVKP